jgi:hypothetical protein
VRWLVLFTIWFSSFTLTAQSNITLQQVLDSIVVKGEMRGVNMKKLINDNINEIHIVKSLPPNQWGTRTLGQAEPLSDGKYNLYILEDMFEDFFNAERVVAHEIGHALGLRHCCIDAYCARVMAAQQTTNPEHIMYEIAYQTYEYERMFDVYFNNIKEKQIKPQHRMRIIRHLGRY